MGGFLQGLGQIAEGAMKGFEFAENMKEKVSTRREKARRADVEKQSREAAKNGEIIYEDYGQNIQSAGTQFAAPAAKPSANSDYSSSMGGLDFMDGANSADVQVTALKNGGMVRKYAEGGLVSMAADPEGVSYKTNMAAGLSAVQPTEPVQQAQPAEQAATQAPEGQGAQRKIDFGRTQSNKLNAARDKALELGDFELASEYQQAGFTVRDNLFKKGLPMAQQVFAKTGDVTGYIKLYNDTHDDGYNVQGHTQNADGSYALKMRQPNGSVQDMNMTSEEMNQMVYQLSNPAARHAGEMEVLQLKAKLKIETDAKVDQKNRENVTLGKDQKLVSGEGKEIASNMVSGSMEDVKTVTGGYLKKGPNGQPEFVRTDNKAPTDYELYQQDPVKYKDFKNSGNKGDGGKQRMDNYKYLNELAVNEFGQTNELTGKKETTEEVRKITRTAQRLIDANPDLPPQTILTIAKDGKDIFEKRRMPNGEIVKVQVIQHNGVTYPYSNAVAEPVKKTEASKPSQPATKSEAPTKALPPAQLRQTKPAGLSVMSEAQADEVMTPTASAPDLQANGDETRKAMDELRQMGTVDLMNRQRDLQGLIKSGRASKDAKMMLDNVTKMLEIKRSKAALK